MVVPNNEGRVCDAVVRPLDKWTHETRSDVRHPDKEGANPPVDLLKQIKCATIYLNLHIQPNAFKTLG